MASPNIESLRTIESGLPEGGSVPRIGIVLGSGLAGAMGALEVAATFGFDRLPSIGRAGVAGHSGEWIVGTLKGVPLHVVAGRRHAYEGAELSVVVESVRLMAALGVRLLILTNAAGGLSRSFRAGDLMLIRDQINLSFRNPLVGPNREDLGPRFPDMSEPFDPAAQMFMRQAALAEGIDLKEGIYAGVLGPNFETPAEIGMLRRMGADAVGMSTVGEVLAARHAGIRVLGLSLITNVCSEVPRLKAETTHGEVLEAGRSASERVGRLFSSAIPRLGRLVESPMFRGTSEKDVDRENP